MTTVDQVRRLVPFGVAVAVGLAAVAVLHRYGARLDDLNVYRRGAESVVTGGSPYHLPHLHYLHHHLQLPFTYPPFAALLLVPTTWWSWPVTYVVWTVLTALCLIWLWRICLPESTMPTWLLYPSVLGSVLLEPVWQNFRLGQINLLLDAVILADLLRGERARGRGLWLGLTIGIKLTPAIFVPFLVLTRQWRALRNTLVGFAFTVALGWVLLPRASVSYWRGLLLDPMRVPDPLQASNQSWSGVLLRAHKVTSGETAPWLVLALVTLVLGLWCARLWWQRGEPLLALAVVGLTGLLVSPVSWTHHWVWCIPIGVAGYAASRRAGVGALLAGSITTGWFAGFVVAPPVRLPHLRHRELLWSTWQNLAGDLYVWMAFLAIAGLLVVALRAGNGPSTASSMRSRRPRGQIRGTSLGHDEHLGPALRRTGA